MWLNPWFDGFSSSRRDGSSVVVWWPAFSTCVMSVSPVLVFSYTNNSPHHPPLAPLVPQQAFLGRLGKAGFVLVFHHQA